jgi:hypothetical protein
MSLGEPLIMVTAFLAQALDASVPAELREKENRVRAMHRVLYEKAGPAEKRALGREYRSRFARDLEAKFKQTEQLGNRLRETLRRGGKSVDEVIEEVVGSTGELVNPAVAILDAAIAGRLEKVKRMLELNPGLIRADERGDSPLHRAVRGGHTDLVQFLLGRNCDLDACDPAGRTPLHWAAATGREDLVGMLIDRGSDVNARNESRLPQRRGKTPLHEAAGANAASDSAIPATIEVLLAHGADTAVKDVQGNTPLDIAQARKRTTVVNLLKKAQGGPTGRAFRAKAPEPSCPIQPISGNAGKHTWRATPDWPVRFITAWAVFVDGVGTEHGGGSQNAWDNATEIAVQATVKGDTLFLTYDRIRKRADGTQTASKTVRTSAPTGATFEWRALTKPAKVTREYLTLWEGLFRKDGHPVKRIVFGVRVAGRNDEPPSPLGPPLDVGPQPFPSSLFDKSP